VRLDEYRKVFASFINIFPQIGNDYNKVLPDPLQNNLTYINYIKSSRFQNLPNLAGKFRNEDCKHKWISHYLYNRNVSHTHLATVQHVENRGEGIEVATFHGRLYPCPIDQCQQHQDKERNICVFYRWYT